MKKIIVVDGMSCNHCAKQIENSFKQAGAKAKADFKTGSVIVKSKQEIPEEQLKKIVESAGYKLK